MRSALGAFLVAAVANSAAGQSKPSAADSAAAEAEFSAGRWAPAASAYSKLVRRDPANGHYWLRYGQALESSKRLPEAESALQRALKLRAQPNVARFRLARIASRNGDVEHAFGLLDEATRAGFSQWDVFRSDSGFASLHADPRFQPLLARVEANRFPCRTHPAARQFDFWIGHWSMRVGGREVGANRISPVSQQCALLEQATTPTLTGTGLSWFDAGLSKWKQVMVFDGGLILDFTGEWRDGAMRFEGVGRYLNGSTQYRRLTFQPYPGDSLRELIEVSMDGKNWSPMFDATYHRLPGEGASASADAGRLTDAERRELVTRLERNRDAIHAIVDGLEPAQWQFKSAPDRWSAAEVLEHIVVVETEVFDSVSTGIVPSQPNPSRAAEVAAMTGVLREVGPDRTKQLPAPPAYLPTGRWKPGAELIEAFDTTRSRMVALAKTSASPLHRQVAEHRGLGPASGYQWLLYAMLHAERHLAQLEEVLKHQNFPTASAGPGSE